MTADRLLRGVRWLQPHHDRESRADVRLRDGAIAEWGEAGSLSSGSEPEQDGSTLVFAPALTDLYSRSGEPGQETRERIAETVACARAGGFSRLQLLPRTQPVLDDSDRLLALRQRFPHPGLDWWAAYSPGTEGDGLTELAELAQAGALGFGDGGPLPSLSLVRRLLEYAQPLGLPLLLWPRHPQLAGGGTARPGALALQLGLPQDPYASETQALAGLLELLAEFPTPVHLMRISTARSVELIAAAKDRGLPVTASTTWLHLIASTAELGSYDPNLRLTPPLGNPEDRQALRQAVRDGVLDAIAVDHVAYRYEEKTVAFGEAPSGTLGYPFALSCLWETLVGGEGWQPLQLWRALTVGPERCLQPAVPSQPCGWILFDPAQPWTAEAATLPTAARNTHLLGHGLRGRVLAQTS